MVTQITLGGAYQSNGKTVLNGSQSQIDTKGLIDALTAAKRAPADKLEAADKTIDTKTSAFNSLKTLLSTFQSAAQTLSNPAGVGNDAKNIFQYRTASVTTNNSTPASSYIDVSVQPGAAIQNFAITNVNFLAQQTKQQSNDIVLADATTASAVTSAGSPVAGLFVAGTVNLRAIDGTPGGIGITLNQGDSLSTVVNKFNAVKTQTGIQASIVTVSTGVGTNTYKIVFSATQTGTDYGFDLGLTSPAVGAGVVSDPSGVFSQQGFFTNQPAQNAQLTIDGVPVTRQTNAIDDLVSGVTINLKQVTAGATLNVNVQPDTDIVETAIQNFADAYNKFRLFVSKQNEVDEDGALKDTAVLGRDLTFRNIVDTMSTEVSRVVAGITGGDPSRLIDVGISLDDFTGDDDNPATKNIMTVDTDKLRSALTANYDGVRAFFEYQMTSDNANFVTFARSNKLNASSVSFNIDITNGVYQATFTDLTSGLVDTVDLDAASNGIGGYTLTGQTGTAFEGMTFIYASTADATVTATITQGIADRFFNALDNFTKTDTGSIDMAKDDLTDTKTRNKAEITKIDDAISKYRDQLIQQYANLESALSKANQILQLLDAQSQARNSGN